MLKIPDATTVSNITDADKILTDFSALSDKDKLEILHRLGTVSIKAEF